MPPGCPREIREWNAIQYFLAQGATPDDIVTVTRQEAESADYKPNEVSPLRFMAFAVSRLLRCRVSNSPPVPPPPPSPTPTLADLKEIDGCTPALDAAVDAAQRELESTWTEEAQAKFLDLIEKRNAAILAASHARRVQTASAIQGATADTDADPIHYIDEWHPPIPTAGSESHARAA